LIPKIGAFNTCWGRSGLDLNCNDTNWDVQASVS